MMDGQKVHLYERANYPEQFRAPKYLKKAFYFCSGLTDYAQMPISWKQLFSPNGNFSTIGSFTLKPKS
jgi:hypothetical protein